MRATVAAILFILPSLCLNAQNGPAFEAAKAIGLERSSYRKPATAARISPDAKPEADLETFRTKIEPLLRESCYQCHGEEKQKGKFRVDTLDPNLLSGGDQSWWLEVIDVISNGEMPPVDDDVELADEGRAEIIDWLSNEIHVASQVRRSEGGHSSFRRMTRYEYNYALQDLLGLQFDFARDLPPETESEDGFQNSSEMLQMSASQFSQYREIARQALRKSTVRGEQPKPIHFEISMTEMTERATRNFESQKKKIEDKFKDDPEKLAKGLEKLSNSNSRNVSLNDVHLINSKAVAISPPRSGYGGKEIRWDPVEEKPQPPTETENQLIIPAGKEQIFDFGDFLPDSGTVLVRFRGSRGSVEEGSYPNLRIRFGFQPSNNSKTSFQVGGKTIAIKAAPNDPQFFEFQVPLGEVSRNPYRGNGVLGRRPNPSEYLIFENMTMAKASPSNQIKIDYVEVTAPYFSQWPPESHKRIFIESEKSDDEKATAREVLSAFMARAWRRPVLDSEIDRKVKLFVKLRPSCEDFEDAMIEVLAGVLSSPQFLYLAQSDETADKLTEHELATRLSMFLWCSVPDSELLDLTESGELSDPKVLSQQTERMLADPKAKRFSEQFTRQWLGMQLLDFLNVDKKFFNQFDADLRNSMKGEPIAFFHELLQENGSVLNFLHADYAMLNERMAVHYGIPDVHGNEFQRVVLKPESRRGGLLTQAGLLAMNSDGKDSHPLKRGIWLLENILHDPPPPPPPAVPEIDLTDPDILKLTLKDRMEDHRNDPACMSCHAKIDPWGIAFENFDAVGRWRDEIGKDAVDANSVLFNQQKLEGMEGLKLFLLENRQDQFARSMVHKLASYALGRPISFADRADLEQITADLRKHDDRLATLITLIVTSEIFVSK